MKITSLCWVQITGSEADYIEFAAGDSEDASAATKIFTSQNLRE